MRSIFLYIFVGISLCSTAQVKRGYIKAGGFNVYFERQGKGQPLLLLHAGLQDHTMWEDQVKSLAANFDIITPDLPFHGKTNGNDSTILAQDVIRIIIDSLHLSKISIAGLSMGAAVTTDFIIAYPNRVNKAILLAAGINGFEKIQPIDSASSNWYVLFSNALDQKDTAGAAKEFTKAWAEGIYRKGDSLQAPVSKYVYQSTLRTLQVHKMAGWPNLRKDPPAVEKLGTIRLPVLVIVGEKDLPYITTASDYLVKQVPGSKLVVVKDVAHMFNMEKPAQVNKLISEFLLN